MTEKITKYRAWLVVLLKTAKTLSTRNLSTTWSIKWAPGTCKITEQNAAEKPVTTTFRQTRQHETAISSCTVTDTLA